MRASQSKTELYVTVHCEQRAGMSMRAVERKYGRTWRTARAGPLGRMSLMWSDHPAPRFYSSGSVRGTTAVIVTPASAAAFNMVRFNSSVSSGGSGS